MSRLAQKTSIKISSPVYTLGVVSNLTEIPKPSIVQYINKGLLIPFKKETNRNLFSEVDVGRLNNIRYLLDEQGLNVAGIKAMMSLIPCWAITRCLSSDRKDCEAYTSISQPCWEASHKGPKCMNADCRKCEVYLCLENYDNLKDVIKHYAITNSEN